MCELSLDPFSFRDNEGLRLTGTLKKIRLSPVQVIDERQKSLLKDARYSKGIGEPREVLSFSLFLSLSVGF